MELDKKQITQWLTDLNSKNTDVKARSEKALAAIEPEAVDILLTILREDSERRLRANRFIKCCLGAMVFFLILACLFYVERGFRTGVWKLPITDMFGYFGIFGAFGATAGASISGRNGAKMLARFEDIRSIGPLSEALWFADKETAAVATGALKRLLPAITPEAAENLTEEQRKALFKSLTLNDTELLSCVLRALVILGDLSAIPAVEKLISSNKQPGVLTLAQDVVTGLRIQETKLREANQLLRASQPQDNSLLLKPVTGNEAVDANQLLRPVDVLEQVNSDVPSTTSSVQQNQTLYS